MEIVTDPNQTCPEEKKETRQDAIEGPELAKAFFEMARARLEQRLPNFVFAGFIAGMKLESVDFSEIQIACDSEFHAEWLHDNQIEAVTEHCSQAFGRLLKVVFVAPKHKEVKTEKVAKQQLAQVIKLPVWGTGTRAMPNELLRSSLFGIVKKGGRTFRKEVSLCSWGNVQIGFTGEDLDQNDCDVFFELLDMSMRKQALEFDFSLYQVLKSMGKTTQTETRRQLRAGIHRLHIASIKIQIGSTAYHGHLIDEFYEDQKTGRYHAKINPKFILIFDGGYARINKTKRRLLKGDLAKALMNIVSTHKALKDKPQRIKLETLKELTRSRLPKKNFKAELKKAMKQLQVNQIILEWRFEKEVLVFSKPKTSQSDRIQNNK